jgi:hypothetical protein
MRELRDRIPRQGLIQIPAKEDRDGSLPMAAQTVGHMDIRTLQLVRDSSVSDISDEFISQPADLIRARSRQFVFHG